MSRKGNKSSTTFSVYLFTCSYFLLIAAVTLRVNQDSVNGTVGQSVLLSASYTISNSSDYLRITWIKAGTRIVEYRCLLKRGNNLTECNYRWSVPDDYRHRVVLFPDNASLLLKCLELNDSGIYKLSISHPAGTEMVRFMLTVHPNSSYRMDGENQRPGVEAKVRYLSLVVVFIFLCFTVKTRRGYKQNQEQTEKGNARQDVRNSSTSNPAVSYRGTKSSESTGTTGRTIHAADENIEHAQIQMLIMVTLLYWTIL
ncbi:uncharacterized protein LOC119976031 [Scyliorhinus canicula]|uniref:uncharacterized protein LOC119976031 n=1 Tax=Scyliorhinus canicula TaxID=7830 RepID=UPI0018F42F8F|nr:uncharacterized protein LOC119976031 [Scyliorhinus canicula]